LTKMYLTHKLCSKNFLTSPTEKCWGVLGSITTFLQMLLKVRNNNISLFYLRFYETTSCCLYAEKVKYVMFQVITNSCEIE
jgi:hypothetical protein